MNHNSLKAHLLLAPFPIALLVAALAGDMAFWMTKDPLCAEMASWLVTAALLSCALSMIAAVIEACWSHVLGSAAALLLVVVNFLMRDGDSAVATIPAGPALSGFAVAILLLAGAVAAQRGPAPRASWRAALANRAWSLHVPHLGR